MSTPTPGRARLTAAAQQLRHASLATYLSTVTLVWGLWLLLPFRSLNTPGWAALTELGITEWQLGLAMTAIGCFKIGAILHGGFRWRRTAAMTSAIAWGFVAAMVIRANPSGTGVAIYSMMAVGVGVDYLWLQYARHLQESRGRV